MNMQARDLGARPSQSFSPTPAMQRVLERLPESIRSGLTETQLAAIDDALDFNNPTRHTVNLRLTFFGRAYFVLLGGPERRNPERRVEERERHPLRSPGNIAVLTVVAILGLTFGYTIRSLVFGT
jgi:hypothetical protein